LLSLFFYYYLFYNCYFIYLIKLIIQNLSPYLVIIWNVFIYLIYNLFSLLKGNWYGFYLFGLNNLKLNYLFLVFLFVITTLIYKNTFSLLYILFLFTSALQITITFSIFDFDFFVCIKLLTQSLWVGLVSIHPFLFYSLNWVLVNIIVYKKRYFKGIKYFLNLIFILTVLTFFTGGWWSMFFLSWSYYWVFDLIEYFPIILGFLILISIHSYSRIFLNYSRLSLFLFLYFVLYCARKGLISSRHAFFSMLSFKLIIIMFFFAFFIFFFLNLKSNKRFSFISTNFLLFGFLLAQLFCSYLYLLILLFILYFFIREVRSVQFSWFLIIMHLIIITSVFW